MTDAGNHAVALGPEAVFGNGTGEDGEGKERLEVFGDGMKK